MTLEVLAHEALGNQERKSYVSAVERGKKKLSPLTIQKFAKALDLPDSLVDPLLQDDVTEDEPTTQTERDADRLFDELTVLRNELKLSESLALALAYEYAEGNPSDLQSALRELKRAFELASRHAPGGNLDSDLSAIMAEVDHLNEEESIEAGSATLRKAMATRRDRIDQEKAAMLSLLDKGIAQAVMERSAEDAAACEVEKIEIEVHDQKSRFDALRSVSIQWYDRGCSKGLNFDLEVSVELSRACIKNAFGPYETGIAMDDLGIARWSRGKQETGTASLEESVIAHRAALDEFSRETEPLDWAKAQNNLGNALQSLGKRENGTQRLKQAVTAFGAALEERTPERSPLQWAMTQNNLGTALIVIGEREDDPEWLKKAVDAYCAALKVRTRGKVPRDWAITKTNLGNALRALGQREPGTELLQDARACFCAALKAYTLEKDALIWAETKGNLGRLEIALFEKTEEPTHLDLAEAHVQAAREVFAEGNATQYLGMADQLLDHINHLRNGPSA